MNQAVVALSRSQITLVDIPPSSLFRVSSEKQNVNGFGSLVKRLGLSKRAVENDRVQVVRLHVSLWLTCYRIPDQEVELWLHYEDEDKFSKILIDSQKLNDGHSLMFEGEAEMEIEGKLESLTLKCSGMGADIPYKVEDFSLRKL